MSRAPNPAEWAVAALAGCVAAALPLARTLGYESAMILAIAGGILALRRGLIEGRRLHYRPSRTEEAGTRTPEVATPPAAPSPAARFLRIRREAAEAFVRATLAPLLALLAPWALLVVSTRFVQGCRAWPGTLLVLFLAFPAVAHFAAAGLLCGAVTTRFRAAAGLIAAGAIAHTAHTASQALSGRTIPHSVPFGFISGSGWGGVGVAGVDLPASYFLLRGLVVAACPLFVTMAALGAARIRAWSHSAGVGHPGRVLGTPAAWLALAVCALPLLAAAMNPSACGLTSGTRARHAELSAEMRTAHVALRFSPGGNAAATAEQLTADAEWDFQIDAAVMDLPDAAPVTVWVYEDDEQMRRLTGAEAFLFALPWRREIHTRWTPEGADELRHELVHVLAADWTRRPLRISWNQALLEGTAEAIASYAFLGGEFQTDAAAALAAGRLTPATRLFASTGFVWGNQSLHNAYRLSASFVGFLIERSGPAALARAYGGAAWTDAYGADLATLDAAWRQRLEGVAISAEERRRAALSFDPVRHPAFHRQRCPRVGEAAPAPERDPAEDTRPGAQALALLRSGHAAEAIDRLTASARDATAPTNGAREAAAPTNGARETSGGPGPAGARPFRDTDELLFLLLIREGRPDEAAAQLERFRTDAPATSVELYEMVARSKAAPQLAEALLLGIGMGQGVDARRRQRALLREALRLEPAGPAAWIAEEWLCAWPPAGTDGAGARLLRRFLDGTPEGGERAVRAAMKLATEALRAGRPEEAIRLAERAAEAAPRARERVEAAEIAARARGLGGAEFFASVLPGLVPHAIISETRGRAQAPRSPS